jgi:site-specific DNA recombinase
LVALFKLQRGRSASAHNASTKPASAAGTSSASTARSQPRAAATVARKLNAAGEVTKRRICPDGARGGKPWTKGAVYKVLANRVYLGEAVHKGVAYPGEHAAIIDQRTWDKAHAVMAEPAHRRGAATRAQVPALLKSLIYGPNGRPMSPSHTRRRGRIYRYYVSREAIADGYDSCAVTSVPAADV